MADGDVRYAPDVLKAQKIVDMVPKELAPKITHYATQFFVNSLISGIKTMQTIIASGFTIQQYESMLKVFAGLGSFNGKLAREGADELFGAYRQLYDGLQAIGASFKAGHSVIDPPLNMYARGGLTNQIVNAPGHAAGALDEFNKVVGYRSLVRAKSLRLAREEGLTGTAVAERLDRDLRLALDPDTGIAQNMTALRQARIPTLSGDVGSNTLGGRVSALLKDIPLFKFVTPFINVSVHSFRYVNKSTPGINLLYKDVRTALANGGEDAARVLARTTAASTVFGTAYHFAAADMVTGRGPSNPALRREWLKTHQPYSVRFGNNWQSYRRFEPFSTFIGLSADLATIQAESQDGDEQSMSDVAGAVYGSYMSNVVNKTYMVGLSNFFKAVSEQDPSSIEDFFGATASGFIPRAVQQFNPDDTYREARGLVDRLMNATPGLSENLPADYGWDGTPNLRAKGMWNRNGSIVPSQPVTPKLEDKLVENGIVLSAPPSSDRTSGIDYNDTDWSTDGSRPYERWMELVDASGIRKTLDSITESPAWTNAPAGSPGSGAKKRSILLQARLDAEQERAFHKMLAEPRYRKLKAAWLKSRALGGENIRSGRGAVDSLKNVIDSIRTSPPQATEALFQ
jgi:hypothetical protein